MPETSVSLAEMVGQALARDAALPAIEFEDQWHTWGDLRRIAHELDRCLASSGIRPDAPVAFVPRNTPASIAALLALLAGQRTVRMVYAFQSPSVIGSEIERLAPAAAIVDSADLAKDIAPTLAEAGIAGIVLNNGSVAPIAGAHLAHGEAALRKGPQTPLIEILTSGTTGPPKQFPITHKMIAESMVGAAALNPAAQAAAATLAPYLLYFPLGNISGIYSTIPTLVRGQRACLLDRFSIADWHRYVLRHRPTHSGIPPASMRALLDADIPVGDLASIKAMGIGAAPLPPGLQRQFEQCYGIPVLLSYGATEFGGPVCAWSPDLHAQWGATKLGSVGRPILGAQLRIIDLETGTEAACGTVGRVEVISPRIGPEWIRTADLGSIDQDGFLFLAGRTDSAIMRGGFKILPDTIERALLQHSAVAEVAVVGVPDKRLSEVPAAMVCLANGMQSTTVATLQRHLRDTLPSTHLPVHWLITDSLPRNASMKIDLQAIRCIFNTLHSHDL
ncbi:class I adenylate-forming enzyme family protein [Novosphingobium sp. AAP83]|uniref:class I adenylate-forming enzyme family protein n=1 Tax=Novosphingobium sp. AAP83 TaxID=1523425 RepID=UPI000A49E508|nr:long-chain fatty acid--CoA ligase [Novosphingobium sp. AAP83]